MVPDSQKCQAIFCNLLKRRSHLVHTACAHHSGVKQVPAATCMAGLTMQIAHSTPHRVDEKNGCSWL